MNHRDKMKTHPYNRYFQSWRSFHLVNGASGGDGGVCIHIRKCRRVWLYRLIRFGETSKYVHDNFGELITYNHIEHAMAFLDRKRKYAAQYNKSRDRPIHVEWDHDEYNDVWQNGLYGSKPVTNKELIANPHCCFISGYKAHFVLEHSTEKRKIYSYYKPLGK